MDPKCVSNITSKGRTRRQWMMAILVNITLLGTGMQIGWIASMAKILQSEESPTGSPLSPYDISWLASIPSLAASLGIPLFAFCVDRIGRKPCIAACAVLQLLGWIITLGFASMKCLMIGRILGGIASGGSVFTVSMYVKEISQDDVRGMLGMIQNMGRNLGVLGMYIMGAYMDYYPVLWTSLAISVINVITVPLVPESPTFYVKIGKTETAISTIAYLRELPEDHKIVQNAIDSIKAEDEKFKSISSVSFTAIFKQKAWRNGFIFMTLVIITSGLQGGFIIQNYAPIILVQSGITVSPQLQSLSIPIFMIIGSLLTLVLIERLGRKSLLGGSYLMSMMSFSVLAAITMIQNTGSAVPGWLTVVTVVVPVCCHAAAISPIPWVICSEMFNFQIRAKVMGFLLVLGWFGAFAQTLIFGPVTATYGLHVIFIAAAIVNLFGTAIVLVLVPETKTKSVDQIEQDLEKKLFKT